MDSKVIKMAYYGNGIGNITTTKASVGTVAIAGLAVGLAAAGVVNAFNMEYFGGMKRNKSYKDIAKRNAALGGAIGAVVTAGMFVA
tara:strand:- start:1296 stop:1553 length:258 start_codon:yes stop_codon:yes gene_type:complete